MQVVDGQIEHYEFKGPLLLYLSECLQKAEPIARNGTQPVRLAEKSPPCLVSVCTSTGDLSLQLGDNADEVDDEKVRCCQVSQSAFLFFCWTTRHNLVDNAHPALATPARAL